MKSLTKLLNVLLPVLSMTAFCQNGTLLPDSVISPQPTWRVAMMIDDIILGQQSRERLILMREDSANCRAEVSTLEQVIDEERTINQGLRAQKENLQEQIENNSLIHENEKQILKNRKKKWFWVALSEAAVILFIVFISN